MRWHTTEAGTKVIFKQLYEFLLKQIVLLYTNMDFISQHSTEFALFELVDRIIGEIKKMNTPVTIFLHLSKAFDKTDREILEDHKKIPFNHIYILF